MLEVSYFNNEAIKKFPDVHNALSSPDGLLALGGDLSKISLLNAYKNGIFPWFSFDEPILWWSPAKRAIIFTDKIYKSKSIKKLFRGNKYNFSIDKNFLDVVNSCSKSNHISDREDTWIFDEMKQAYYNLFLSGHAHSIEVWRDNKLVGGMYGVFINNCFCGESMFSLESNTSKMALIFLCDFLSKNNCNLLDCQLETPHLTAMGAEIIYRDLFIKKLQEQNINNKLDKCNWSALWKQQ